MPASLAPPQHRSGRAAWFWIALVAAVCAVALVLTLRRAPLPKPVLLAKTQAFPASILNHQGVWYWLEKTKDAERLIRATEAGAKEVASAEALPRYDLADERLGWTARQGKRWMVSLAGLDGSGAQVLWSGDEEPMGLKLTADRAYWLRRSPAPGFANAPFPPLAASLEVVSVPFAGGAPTPLARIAESEDGAVLGTQGDALFCVAYRRLFPGSFSVYQIPLKGGTPTRRFRGGGTPQILLTQDGRLYWCALSQEVSGPRWAFILYRQREGGEPEAITDWLPQGGRLYETAQGVVYADKEPTASLWREGRRDAFPQAIPLPPGYSGLAAGGEEALLVSAMDSRSTPTLYRMPLP